VARSPRRGLLRNGEGVRYEDETSELTAADPAAAAARPVTSAYRGVPAWRHGERAAGAPGVPGMPGVPGLPAGEGTSATNGNAQVTSLKVLRPSEEARGDLGPASTAPPLDDSAVEGAKRGEPSSWEAAYLAYGKALMGYLMVRLENRDDAADALSETFMRAIDRVTSFRGDAYAFRAWLFTIARNVSTDQHRRRGRVVVIADHPDIEDRGQPSSEDVTILKEDVAWLRRGFGRLPIADQELLWLRVCSGLSAAEVGEVMGKRAGAVRMQQMRALESLRDQL